MDHKTFVDLTIEKAECADRYSERIEITKWLILGEGFDMTTWWEGALSWGR